VPAAVCPTVAASAQQLCAHSRIKLPDCGMCCELLRTLLWHPAAQHNYPNAHMCVHCCTLPCCTGCRPAAELTPQLQVQAPRLLLLPAAPLLLLPRVHLPPRVTRSVLSLRHSCRCRHCCSCCRQQLLCCCQVCTCHPSDPIRAQLTPQLQALLLLLSLAAPLLLPSVHLPPV
jgi:hypothetical protein